MEHLTWSLGDDNNKMFKVFGVWVGNQTNGNKKTVNRYTKKCDHLVMSRTQTDKLRIELSFDIIYHKP